MGQHAASSATLRHPYLIRGPAVAAFGRNSVPDKSEAVKQRGAAGGSHAVLYPRHNRIFPLERGVALQDLGGALLLVYGPHVHRVCVQAIHPVYRKLIEVPEGRVAYKEHVNVVLTTS